MKKINRLQAYRTIYALARQQGWNNEELHQQLAEWGFNPPSLKMMNSVKLHEVLKCFGLNLFVHDPGAVAQLSVLMTKKSDRIIPYINKRFQKDSIYQLTNRQARSTLAMLYNYTKKEK